MTDWVDLSASGLIVERSQPYFLVESDLPIAAALLPSSGKLVVADLRPCQSAIEVIDVLKSVLPFPDWCASSWDSVDDASPDILKQWPFPLILVIDGLPKLWAQSHHLAVQTTTRLAEISYSFSSAGKQVIVAYLDN